MSDTDLSSSARPHREPSVRREDAVPREGAFRLEYPRALLVIGAVIALVALGRIATNEFVEWDDSIFLAQNERFNPPTVRSVLAYALPRNADVYLYIPLTDFCWGALAAIAYVNSPDANGVHLNPWIFHSANVGVHLLSAILVFVCLLKMLALTDRGGRHIWPAWAGAMLFAIHPVQIEAIAWACGMKDLLSGFFAFLAIYFFLRFRESEPARTNTDDGHPWLWYGLATLSLILANFSKPAAVALPLGVLVLDVAIVRTTLRRSIIALLPWFISVIPFILIARSIQQFGWTDIRPIPFALRPLVATDALAFYIGKIFWPASLAFDYGQTPQFVLGSWLGYADWLMPAAVVVVLARARHSRLAIAGVLFAIAVLMPVLGFVPFGFQAFSTVADHYLYPSMLGVGMIAAWTVQHFRGRWCAIAVWIVLGGCVVQSNRQGALWNNTEALCNHELAVNPDSSSAYDGLGISDEQAGDMPAAVAYFRRSVALNARNGFARLNLSNALLDTGDTAGALHELQEMTRYYQLEIHARRQVVLQADVAIAHLMLRTGHPREAIEACHTALVIDPNQPEARKLLAEAQRSVASHAPQPWSSRRPAALTSPGLAP